MRKGGGGAEGAYSAGCGGVKVAGWRREEYTGG